MTTQKPKFYTYPSVSATIFDVPEPKNLSAKFKYNYFTTSERVDFEFTQEQFKEHRNKPPRQVNLRFTPLNSVIPNASDLSEVNLSDTKKQRILEKNKDKITKETEFLSSGRMSMQLQDSTVSDRLLSSVYSTLLSQGISAQGLSPAETMFLYSSQNTGVVNVQKLLDSVNLDSGDEYVAIDPATGEPFEVTKAGDVSKLTFSTTFSQKVVANVANAAIKTPLSPLREMLTGKIGDINTAQADARMGNSTRDISVGDFSTTLDPVNIDKIGIDDVFLGGNTVMGYRIRKQNVTDGALAEDFFITNTNARNFEDSQVIYGKKYNYSISVIYLVKIFCFEGDNVISADVLIESRESPSINVNCIETVPPKAPDGLRFYLLSSGQLILEWDFPVNPTGDVKRFQVFRRANQNLPFDLIAQLDFDDSNPQGPRSENVPLALNRILRTPTTSMCDVSFDLDSDFIYSVCAVDAHDLTSGYSEQYRVRYDKISAKLVVEFISEKNAPKAYPNFLLRQKLAEDVIKDSNHTSVCVYFDPEYLKIFNADKEEVDFLQVSEDEVSYKMQLMHLNFQQSVVANINIK